MGSACIGIGCMAAGYVADAIGRKRSFYVTAIGSGLGTVIEVTSGIGGARFWQLVAGKLVICLAIGVASVSVPLYLAECAPGPIRGAMVNSYVWVQCESESACPPFGSPIDRVRQQRSEASWHTVSSMASWKSNLKWYGSCQSACRCWLRSSPASWHPASPSRPDGSWKKVARKRPGRPSCFSEVAKTVTMSMPTCADWRRTSRWPRVRDNWAGSSASRDVIWPEPTSVSVSRGQWAVVDRPLHSKLMKMLGARSLQQGQGLAFIANYMVIFFIQLGIQNPYMILLISKRHYGRTSCDPYLYVLLHEQSMEPS